MKTTIALLVLFFAVLGGGYALYTHNQTAFTEPSSDYGAPTASSTTAEATTTVTNPATPSSSGSAAATPSNPAGTPSTGGTTPAPGTYTSAQIASHNTASSCWTSVNAGVYDLTSWISQHPGGKGAILSICGKDGTRTFEAQHGGDGRAEAALSNFKIGALAS